MDYSSQDSNPLDFSKAVRDTVDNGNNQPITSTSEINPIQVKSILSKYFSKINCSFLLFRMKTIIVVLIVGNHRPVESLMLKNLSTQMIQRIK